MNTPTTCPECKQNTLYHNEGISKKGKPYANNKCKCGFIEWLEAPKGGSEIGGVVVLEAIQAGFKGIDERLDRLAKYLEERLK